jgi:hypothetical protein
MAVCRTRRIGERNEEWNEERENSKRENPESVKPGMRNAGIYKTRNGKIRSQVQNENDISTKIFSHLYDNFFPGFL